MIKKAIPIFSANLVFTLTMLLVITLGSVIQSVNLSWGLIATEVLIIALPTVLFLRWKKVPLKEGLRLNPLRPLTAALCVLLGISTFLFSSIIEEVMAQLTQMASVPVSADLMPKTALEMVIYFVALAVSAPICEEILFRGAIQGAYEAKKSVRFAITITALMFAFYHYRLSGLPGLLPVAFILGYVMWRTQSLFAPMLIHFGMNAGAGANTIHYLLTQKGLPFLSLWSGLGGLVVTVIVLVLIKRMYPAPAKEAADAAGVITPRRGFLASYWPLFVAGFLYTSVAASLIPGLVPSTTLKYGKVFMSALVESRYEVHNANGDVVGSLTCTVTPQASTWEMRCTRTIKAYEVQTKTGFFKDEDNSAAWSASWDRGTMDLLNFQYEKAYPAGKSITAEMKDGKLVVDQGEGAKEIAFAKNGLMEYEWAWRTCLLLGNNGRAFLAPFSRMMTWDEALKKSAPLVKDEIIKLYNSEKISLPAGEFTARKVTVGNLTAWFADEDAIAGSPRPIKFEDDMVSYWLVK